MDMRDGFEPAEIWGSVATFQTRSRHTYSMSRFVVQSNILKGTA